MTSHSELTRSWNKRISSSVLATEVIAGLDDRAAEIWKGTFDLLRKQSPEYRNAVDDAFTAESKRHCGELLSTIVAVGRGRLKAADPFAFVRQHAEWRARHNVPLVASLHAYRLAHKTYYNLTREQLVRHRKGKQALEALATLSDFWLEFFETVGSILEEAHNAEEARLIAQNSQEHASVIEKLLSGIEPISCEGQQLLTLCGMRPVRRMTVALIRPFTPDSKEIDAEVARRSYVRLIQQTMPSSVFGKLIGLRNGEVVLIVNSDMDTAARLARHFARSGIGKRAESGVCVGIGLDKVHIERIPDALSEARIALDLANSERALVRFSELDLTEILVHRADRAVMRLIPQWLHEAHDSRSDPELITTIRAFAESSLNVKVTAGKLRVHPNTVYFRLNQIQKHTGIDPRTFSGTSLLVNSLRLLDSQPGDRTRIRK